MQSVADSSEGAQGELGVAGHEGQAEHLQASVIRFNARHSVAEHPVHAGKISAYENVVVGQNRQRIDGVIGSRPRVEGGVKRTVSVEPREAIAIRIVHGREAACDYYLALRLTSKGEDCPVSPDPGVE